MPLFRDREAPGPSVGRILVATDRSQTADYAVAWAAEMSERYDAELILLQVVIGGGSASIEELQQFAGEVAGERGRARVVSGDDPADAICDAAEEEDVDVVVVGNVGMSGRKEFLLGNVPNRVSHNTRRTVVIVNTAIALEQPKKRFWR
jgi:ubiquinone biosynthesis protein